MKIWGVLIIVMFFSVTLRAQSNALAGLTSPILFKGNDTTAYRDPAILYQKGIFYLFFTLVKTESGKVYSYTAMSHSPDLKNWSVIQIITPKNQDWDFSSPGDVVRVHDEWVLCLQTYPRPGYSVEQMPRFGTNDARLFMMRSKDLLHWSRPKLMKVIGDTVSFAKMGRMIDPYLLKDQHHKGKWWCFYKQNGICMSYSYDMRHWTYFGKTQSGENPCVLYKHRQYILCYSLKNGIGIKRSADLLHWQEWGDIITLGQDKWPWARGRLTAGTVVDLTRNKRFGKYLMFFHGSGPLTEEQGDFDKNASIGIAWSNDLMKWNWPGK